MDQELRTPSPKRETQPIPSLRIEVQQHLRLLDVDKPQGRVICECWNCKQGLLIQHERQPQQETKVTCPNCGRVAVKLQVAKILSVIPIPSPWAPWGN
ncbi:hypothetical protein [Scytonema sp. NUACC21]